MVLRLLLGAFILFQVEKMVTVGQSSNGTPLQIKSGLTAKEKARLGLDMICRLDLSRPQAEG